MARIHLEVIVLPTDEPVSTMRFDTKHPATTILEQIAGQRNDPSLKSAKLLLQRRAGDCAWIKKSANLKSVGAKNDMKLYVLRNPFVIKFTCSGGVEEQKEVTVNPKQRISEMLSRFTEVVKPPSSQGYSIFPIVQGREVTVDESLSLFEQVPVFDSVVYRIKYYKWNEEHESGAIALYKAYCQARDFLLTGSSLLPFKVYIKLCAEVAVIESGDNINEYLSQFDTGIFARFLPKFMQKDAAEDDLFQAVSKVKQDDVAEMRRRFVDHARKNKLFGQLAFDAEMNGEKVEVCVGYDGVSVVKAGKFSIIQTLKWDLTAETEDVDKVVVTEVSGAGEDDMCIVGETRVFLSQYSKEIKNAVIGYQEFRTVCETTNAHEESSGVELLSVDTRANATVDPPKPMQLGESLFAHMLTGSVRGILALNAAKSHNDSGKVELTAISSLYLVEAEVFPDMFGLSFRTDVRELRSEAESIYQTLLYVESNARFGLTLTELNDTYGNDLRCVLYLLYELEINQMCRVLRENIHKVYRRVCSELNSKVVVARVLDKTLERKISPKPSLDKLMITIPQIRKEIPEIRNSDVVKKSKVHTRHLDEIEHLLMGLSSFFFNMVQQTDEMIFPTVRDSLAQFHSQIAKWIPVAAAIDRIAKGKLCVSQELSVVLECIDSISIFTSLFPKVSFSVLDMSCFYVMTAQGLEFIRDAVPSAVLTRNIACIGKLIADIRELVPPITDHFVETGTLKAVEEKMIQLQYEVASRHSFFERNSLKNEESITKFAILLGRWGILHISTDFIFDAGGKKRKAKHPKRRVANIKVPKDISTDDLVELSQSMIESLKWETTTESEFVKDSEQKAQEFLKEIGKPENNIKDIYELFSKWKLILPQLDPKAPSFAVARQEYDIGMDVLMANFQRQRKFQPTSLLKRKLLHHLENLDSEKLSETKAKLIQFHESMTGRERDLNVETKGPLEEIINEITAFPDKTSDLESVLTILVRLRDFAKDFGVGAFTFVDVIRDLFAAVEELKNIMIAVIYTQSNVMASKVLQILVARFLQLNEFYITLMRTVLNADSKKSMTKRISKVRKGLEGLQVVLTERHLDVDTITLMMSLSNLRWKIMHFPDEDSLSDRHDVLAQGVASHISTLKESIEGKNLEPLCDALTRLQEKIMSPERCSDEIIMSLRELHPLYEQRKELEIEAHVVALVHTTSALIGQLEMKPFVFVFEQENVGECNCDPSSPRTKISQKELAATPRKHVATSPSMRELSFRLSSVHRSKSDLNMARLLKRPGILLDSKTTQHRLPAGPHVTLDLTASGCSILASDGTNSNETVSEEFLPIPVKTPCFESWDLALFVQTIKIPSIPEDEFDPKPTVEEQKVSFRNLKIPAYKEQKVDPYPDEAEAESEVDVISTQIRNCLSRMANLKFVGLIGERVFWVLDWKNVLSMVPRVLSAAKGFDLPQIEETRRDYNAIKVEIDGLVDELQMSGHASILTYVRHLEKLFNLLVFSLDAASCEVMGKEANIYAACKGWLPHFIDARNMFSKLVASNDTPPIIASRSMINEALTYVLRFQSEATMIDRGTNRSILAMTQTEICFSCRKLLRKIKKCNVRDNTTMNQATFAIQEIQKDKNLLALDPNLSSICQDVLAKIGRNEFSIADADLASGRISEIISSAKKQHKQTNNALILILEGLRYTIMSLKFSAGVRDTEFVSQMEDVGRSLRTINKSLLEMTDKEGSVYARNVANPWNEFFLDVIEQFETLKRVSGILSKGSRRYRTIYRYINEVSAVLVRLDGRHFPFPTIQLFGQLSKVYQKLKDYLQAQFMEEQNEPKGSQAPMPDIVRMISETISVPALDYSLNVPVPAREESPVPGYVCLRIVIKNMARQKFSSISDVFNLNAAVCESLLQMAKKSQTEDDIVAAFKAREFTKGSDRPVWKTEFHAMEQLYHISEFLCELSVQNMKKVLKEKTDFAKSETLYKALFKDDKWNPSWIASIETEIPIYEKVQGLLAHIQPTNEISESTKEELVTGLNRDIDVAIEPARAHDLVPVISQIQKFFVGIFYADDLPTIVDRLKRFIEAGQLFAKVFSSIPNTNYVHMKLGKRLKSNMVNLVKTAGSPDFHQYWNLVSVELEQVSGIIQIIEAEELATTEKEKFASLMRQMEKVIQTLFQVKEERTLNMSIVLESVANVLLELKHAPALSFRLKLTVGEFRNFVITAHNILFATPETVEECLDLLVSAVVPSFSCASAVRQSISLIIQGYRNRCAGN